MVRKLGPSGLGHSDLSLLHFLNFRAEIKDFLERVTIDNLKIVANDFKSLILFLWWHVQLRELSRYFSVIILHYFRLKKKLTYVNARDSWSILSNFSHVKNTTFGDVKLILCFIHFLNFRTKKKRHFVSAWQFENWCWWFLF